MPEVDEGLPGLTEELDAEQLSRHTGRLDRDLPVSGTVKLPAYTIRNIFQGVVQRQEEQQQWQEGTPPILQQASLGQLPQAQVEFSDAELLGKRL
jgi:hypothetical protein